MAGDRDVPTWFKNASKRDVIGFFAHSKSASKSRQKMRNKATYKQFIELMGDGFNKCQCCLYPAHESIYGKYLCEQCIDKMKLKTIESSKEDLTD